MTILLSGSFFHYARNSWDRQAGSKNLPFTFWTDLGYKELPSVKITEGSILTEHNRSINWNLANSLPFKYLWYNYGIFGTNKL